MTSAYQQLCEKFKRIDRLDHANTFLTWDQMVMMPKNGVEARSRSLAEIADIRHELLTSDELETLFTEASEEVQAQGDRANLREMRKQWQESICLPAELVTKKILAGAKCEHAWRTQRGNSDWKGFLGNFKEVLQLARQEASLRQQANGDRFKVPYDALLDLYCSGDTSDMISSVFAGLKKRLPELIEQIVEKQSAVTVAPITGQFSVENQTTLNRRLMCDLGFDFDGGRLDVSLHPFSTGMKGDLRITTRFLESEFVNALQATAHETGHSSYEGGLPDEWAGLPAGAHRNMCIHESQSLLFEKQIFLSRAFTEYFCKSIKEIFPELASLSAEQLWRSSTRVKPSYIRTEADEVSYPMHVMLRYEIESALINGDAQAEDIPEMWESRMQEFLGLSIGDDHNNGCMQDIHWTDGAFGYFPSYTLGAVNGAQLFAKIKQLYPDWQQRFASGDVLFVRDWLKKNIWQQGSMLESQELMQQATGEGSNAAHLLAHLEARYLREEY